MGLHNTGKAFVSRLHTALNSRVGVTLTAKQRFFLDGLVHRYRRQLVRLLPEELQLTEPPVEADYCGPVQTVPDLFTGEESPPHETESHAHTHHPQRDLF